MDISLAAKMGQYKWWYARALPFEPDVRAQATRIGGRWAQHERETDEQPTDPPPTQPSPRATAMLVEFLTDAQLMRFAQQLAEIGLHG